MTVNILLLVAGLIVLIVGGEFLVRGAVGIAKKFRISTLVIGMTVVSFGTSAPELLVSVQASLGGHPDIAIGNVIGSNVANIGLVLGITAEQASSSFGKVMDKRVRVPVGEPRPVARPPVVEPISAE